MFIMQDTLQYAWPAEEAIKIWGRGALKIFAFEKLNFKRGHGPLLPPPMAR